MKNHLMLDLETMGNKSNSAIVSIGAVQFDLETGELGKVFYSGVNLKSCLDIGLKINPDTLYWWLTQNEQARLAVAKGGPDLDTVLDRFNSFLFDISEENIKNLYLWGNSARFDLGIFEDAYIACNTKVRWDFRKERDVRTLVSFIPEIKSRVQSENTGVEHNPIDDCKLQIKYCVEIWQKINKNMKLSI
jgi:DNA polymerase III epsilon subunit-like protein